MSASSQKNFGRFRAGYSWFIIDTMLYGDRSAIVLRGLRDAFLKTGMYAVQAGAFVGRKAIEGYNAIDPDVRRYFFHLPLLGYSLLVSRREKIDPGVPDGRLPVIFVHGLGGNRGTFLPMAWYIRFLGRKRSYKIHFDGGQSMDQMARALADFVRDVLKATCEEKVDIVGHSLGGVISHMAIVDYGVGDKVNFLITLGAPHRGTYAARYANTEITRDLRPDSELMKRLKDKPLPDNIRTVNFFSRNDILIVPPESATLDGAEHVDASPFTHLSYLIDPKCWAAVGRLLSA